eukprot:gnl/TRDRNA2_/TRDRNA2_29996_c0_seq1.p1 gnl/TRDRNA2_/TRDRNA2_29996_c0~~gnl/TRDRNA2_/TRDRNA2_29996_c0_seq1.p1  ORF type:complete len:414 (+),score=38.30 gnl/TRDRNA2_/TRDRNA2_29996_c0_seq1:73-1242(+)
MSPGEKDEIIKRKLGSLLGFAADSSRSRLESKLRSKVHLIDTVWGEWGAIWGMQQALVKAALDFDQGRGHVAGGVFLSESCVPIKSFGTLWTLVMEQKIPSDSSTGDFIARHEQNGNTLGVRNGREVEHTIESASSPCKSHEQGDNVVVLDRNLSILYFSEPDTFYKTSSWGFFARDLMEKVAYGTEIGTGTENSRWIRFLDEPKHMSKQVGWSEWYRLPHYQCETATAMVVQHFGIPVRHGRTTFDCWSVEMLEEQISSSHASEPWEFAVMQSTLQTGSPLHFGHYLPLSFLEELRNHSEAVFLRKVQRWQTSAKADEGVAPGEHAFKLFFDNKDRYPYPLSELWNLNLTPNCSLSDLVDWDFTSAAVMANLEVAIRQRRWNTRGPQT